MTSTVETKQAYRYELDPNNRQRGWLRRCARLRQFVYNRGIDAVFTRFKMNDGDDKFYDGYGELQSAWRDYRDSVPAVKCMTEGVPSDVALFCCKDVKQAYDNWWKHGGRKPRPNRSKPSRFKIKRQGVKVGERSVKLPYGVRIRTKEEIRLRGQQIGAATITREGDGRWYISFPVEREREVKHAGGPAVGLDWGLNSFITLSTGEKVDAPKPLSKALKRLKRMDRQLSRKQGPRHPNGPSNNWRKLMGKKRRLQRRIGNIREDFANKLSTRLAKEFGTIAVENLAIANMLGNQHISRAIADAAPGMFFQKLKHKAEWYGCEVVEAGRWFPSTQKCSSCGYIREGEEKLSMSERTYKCPECGFVEDRDVNAACNLKQEVGGVSPEPNAPGESPRRASSLFHGCSPASLNGEGGSP